MSKKVLVLSSSPRRGGNSDTLCDQFVLGAQEAGHYSEKIYFMDKKINYCTGCGTCYEERKGCIQNDDMAEILEKMIEADIIVMATPVYFYTMCAQMKTIIDRTCARNNELKDKDFYFIMTAGVKNKKAMYRTLEEFRGFTKCLRNPIEKGIVYGIGAWKLGEIENNKAMTQAFNMGKAL